MGKSVYKSIDLRVVGLLLYVWVVVISYLFCSIMVEFSLYVLELVCVLSVAGYMLCVLIMACALLILWRLVFTLVLVGEQSLVSIIHLFQLEIMMLGSEECICYCCLYLSPLVIKVFSNIIEFMVCFIILN